MEFFTDFTREKTPQNNFFRQNFSVENNYLPLLKFFQKILESLKTQENHFSTLKFGESRLTKRRQTFQNSP